MGIDVYLYSKEAIMKYIDFSRNEDADNLEIRQVNALTAIAMCLYNIQELQINRPPKWEHD